MCLDVEIRESRIAEEIKKKDKMKSDAKINVKII
jgi:hypothetical protein